MRQVSVSIAIVLGCLTTLTNAQQAALTGGPNPQQVEEFLKRTGWESHHVGCVSASVTSSKWDPSPAIAPPGTGNNSPRPRVDWPVP